MLFCQHGVPDGEQSTSEQLGLADMLVAIANCQASLTILTSKVEAVQLKVGLYQPGYGEVLAQLG